MKDKTAMQELIERLRVMMDDLPSGSSRALGLATATDLATDLKEKEKQQIMNSWMDGKENKQFGYDVFDDAEKYYTYTFILNK